MSEATRLSMGSETDESVYETNDTSSFVSDISSHDDGLDMELMKEERFASLVLGGDRTGGAHAVGGSTCSAVSQSIANLYGSVTPERLQPLDPECKARWKKEMNFLLAPCAHMGEYKVLLGFVQRPDIRDGLPVLRKLDAMLLDILDSYKETEFSYEGPSSSSNEKMRIPSGGLSKESRSQLKKSHTSAREIFKAAQKMNDSFVAEMEVPESYIASLPKTGKQAVGNEVYLCMAVQDSFSAEAVLNQLDLSTDSKVVRTLDDMEAAVCIWGSKASGKLVRSRSSWNAIVSRINGAPVEYNARVERAEAVINLLKHKHPKLRTSLTAKKIEDNKDLGKATLESYSRVLASLACTIASLIDDVLNQDKLNIRV